MKSIDAEILSVEQRIHARKAVLGRTAGAAKRRAVQRLKSPALIGGAVAAGVLVAVLVHRKATAREPVVAEDTKEQGKGFALGTLLMTGATWLVRSQFGGPVGLAQFVLSKLREGRSSTTAAPAQLPR